MHGNLPNILLLMTDQQRFDSLGCYGAEFAHTPNLDRLADEGACFENCYVTNPICTPSRASLMTGKTLPEHGVYRLYDNLPHQEILFTKRLQDAGYTTALFGKLHVSSRGSEERERHPNDGFDIYEWCMEGGLAMESPLQAYAAWLKEEHPAFHDRLRKEFRNVLHHPPECHFTHWAAERTIDFIQNWDDEKPFFCMTSIFDPHNPYQDYPESVAKLIDRDAIPDPHIVEDEFVGKPEELLREHRNSYMGNFAKYSLEDLREMRFGYHASIAFLDQEFGRILDALDARGLTQNTLVIFTSDHGDMLGDHQLLVKGAFFYDPNVKVPLLMRWPEKIPSRQRADGLVQLHDLAATILTAAGLQDSNISHWMPDAVNLLPLASGQQTQVRDSAVCCYRNSGLSSEPSATPYFSPPINATMLREQRYKLNLWHPSTASQHVAGELYDMETDPNEENNLWNDPETAPFRLCLTEKLLQWLATQEIRNCQTVDQCLPTQKLKNTTK